MSKWKDIEKRCSDQSVEWGGEWGAKDLEFIENGKSIWFYFSCCTCGSGWFGRWEESVGLYYSQANIIRRGGWNQRHIWKPVENLRWSFFAKNYFHFPVLRENDTKLPILLNTRIIRYPRCNIKNNSYLNNLL